MTVGVVEQLRGEEFGGGGEFDEAVCGKDGTGG
jgi:hypothetical protein